MKDAWILWLGAVRSAYKNNRLLARRNAWEMQHSVVGVYSKLCMHIVRLYLYWACLQVHSRTFQRYMMKSRTDCVVSWLVEFVLVVLRFAFLMEFIGILWNACPLQIETRNIVSSTHALRGRLSEKLDPQRSDQMQFNDFCWEKVALELGGDPPQRKPDQGEEFFV